MSTPTEGAQRLAASSVEPVARDAAIEECAAYIDSVASFYPPDGGSKSLLVTMAKEVRSLGTVPHVAWQDPTNAQLSSACMSYRHDYGLLDATAQQTMKWQAKEWLIAWRKEGFGCDRNEVIERCAVVVDKANKEGPYQAIAAASRIRALKDGPHPRNDRSTEAE